MTDNPMSNHSLKFTIKAIQDDARKPLEAKIEELRSALGYLVLRHEEEQAATNMNQAFNRERWFQNALIRARVVLKETDKDRS